MEPLYMSIMQSIKERIINGYYPLKSLLPTEVELEKEFNVSKITIRKAVELLEREGYVSKKSGKGTTIISNAIFNKMSKSSTFTALLQNQGYQLKKDYTFFEYIDLSPQDELYSYFGKISLKVSRIYYLDGKPYIHYDYYLPGNIEIPHISDDNQFSVYSLLFKNKYYLKKITDEFYIDYPTSKILDQLNMDDGPVLGRKRISFNNKNEVIEVSYAQYNTRLSSYKIEFEI